MLNQPCLSAFVSSPGSKPRKPPPTPIKPAEPLPSLVVCPSRKLLTTPAPLPIPPLPRPTPANALAPYPSATSLERCGHLAAA